MQTAVGIDITPPSVPGSFAAVPVSSDQVDLSWIASTDNAAIYGYHVWRDGVVIATTSLLSYSDVGLSASTLYTYYVTALDTSFNESASSTVVSTSTLAAPDPGTTVGSSFPSLDSMLSEIAIRPGQHDATITFSTYGMFRAVIKWGQTPSFELGSIAEHAYSTSHETYIDGLEPDTEYYFTIEGESEGRGYGTIYNGTFMTLPQDDIFPPSNILDFTGVWVEEHIELSWSNPPESDFDKVRIVRNNIFYPSDIADGWVVYEGSGTGVSDFGADPYKDTYYTIFTYDERGNISSGSVLKVSALFGGVAEDKETDPQDHTFTLLFADIIFTQERRTIESEDGVVVIDGSKNLKVSVPYELFPRQLKTILLKIVNEDNPNQSHTFLLRINAVGTMYETVIPALGKAQVYKLNLSVYDHKASKLSSTDGLLISEFTQLKVAHSKWMYFFFCLKWIWWPLLLILFIYWCVRKEQERRKKCEEHHL